MKVIKSILITVVCSAVILLCGYVGIILSGYFVLESSGGPEPITISGNISNLFYSRMEDDIQLYPWNYYTEDPQQQESAEWANELFTVYDPFLENNVFYTLISLAAGVEPQEVSQWYDSQEKTILMSMVKGMDTERNIDLYFYSDMVRLGGKDYQVKISCNEFTIISFSCISSSGEEVKESEEWDNNKEELIKWMEENRDLLYQAFDLMYVSLYKVSSTEDWYSYVDLYMIGITTLQGSMDPLKDVKNNGQGSEAMENTLNYSYETPIQMFELKDSILMAVEDYMMTGLYYDVVNKRFAGFHFFYN